MWDENPRWLERHGRMLLILAAVCSGLWMLAAMVTGNGGLAYVGLACGSVMVATVLANVVVLALVVVPARIVWALVRRPRRV